MNDAAAPTEVRVPDLGNFKDVEVIDVLVKPGDRIEVEAPLITLETDKATMDVPSTAAGTIERIHTAKGGKVNSGDVVVTLKAEGAQPTAAAPATPSRAAAPAAPAASATPAVRTPPAAAAPPPAAQSASPEKAAPVPVAAAGAPSARSASGNGAAAASPAATAAAQPATAQPATAQPSSAQAASAAATEPAGGRMVPRSMLGQPTSYRADLAPIDEPGFARAHAGPSVRRFARELGVDLTKVAGHGFKDRITHEDVKAFVKGTLVSPGAAEAPPAVAGGASPVPVSRPPTPAVPAVDFAQFGPTELEPLTRIQRISGPRLQASWMTIPHVTQFDEADITELEQLRASLKDRAQAAGVKLTPLAFIMRACVKALQEFPRFNTSLDASGANLVVKKYMHMGFAADTANGLVVPVVRDADRKDVYELARHLGQLSDKARAGKLPPTDMQGGCFTISSLGGIGGTAFTPIINAPEVAILGVSRSVMRPVYRDGGFVPRLLLPLSLSYDHRVIDGALAVRFTTFLAQTLAEPRGLLEAVL